jgi:hypothetical protein
MRHPLEVHPAHVEVTAQDTLYSFMVDTQYLGDLLLSKVSLAFD